MFVKIKQCNHSCKSKIFN